MGIRKQQNSASKPSPSGNITRWTVQRMGIKRETNGKLAGTYKNDKNVKNDKNFYGKKDSSLKCGLYPLKA